jgi:DNA polymerase-3 subunit beta
VRIDVTLESTPPGISLLLPKDRLSAILGSFTGDEITITPDDTSCVIKAGRGEWTLPTEDAGEYPAWDVGTTKLVTRMPASLLARAVNGVVFAVDDESSRYALGAVLIDVQGDTVNFVATDGRRLACVQCERSQNENNDELSPLVPARAMGHIARLAAGAGEECVELFATNNEIVATIGNATVTARLLDGRFPKWRDTIKDRQSKSTTVSRADLLASTRAAAIVTSEESKGVQFVFSQDGIWLQGKSAEKGKSSVTCDVVEAGNSATVTLDPLFVQQWLKGIDDESEPNVAVEAVDRESSVVMRCEKDNEKNTYFYTCVIMPLAVD